ncbi:MAG: hypothetical protein AB7N80_07820 [Bdellovibrionales bacterium]
MKKIVYILCLIFINAADAVNLLEGEHEFSSNCKVQVTKHDGWFYLRFDQSPSFSSVKMSLSGEELVGGLGICNDEQKEYPARYHKKTVGKYLVYSARCGGKNDRLDYVLNFVIDKERAKVVHAFAENKVARYSLGSKHSGRWSKVKQDGELVCPNDKELSGVEAFRSRKAIENKLDTEANEVKDFLTLEEALKQSQQNQKPTLEKKPAAKKQRGTAS